MSSENLDLVRSIYADWESGDFSRADWAEPEIEFVMIGGPSPGTWTGLVGTAEAARELLSVWEGLRVEAEEYGDLDGERVLVLQHIAARGKASGLEVGHMPWRGAYLFYLRDGQVTKVVGYWDRDHALADLGLEG